MFIHLKSDDVSFLLLINVIMGETLLGSQREPRYLND